jgi:hypothetical protein
MAFGQNTRIVAFPQPGTSNQPFPVGNLPAYVPVSTTITDTHTPAIINQTTKLSLALEQESFFIQAELAFISAALNQLNNNIARLADVTTAQISAVSNLEVVLGVKTVTEISKTSLAVTAATNQIKTNNFGRAITQEKPKLDTFEQQLRDSVKDAINLNTISALNSGVTSTINTTISATTGVIAKTETFKGLSSWFNSVKNTILSALFPPSAAQLASNAAAVAGVKNISSN